MSIMLPSLIRVWSDEIRDLGVACVGTFDDNNEGKALCVASGFSGNTYAIRGINVEEETIERETLNQKECHHSHGCKHDKPKTC